MTTGTRTIGALGSDFYFFKSWNGGNSTTNKSTRPPKPVYSREYYWSWGYDSHLKKWVRVQRFRLVRPKNRPTKRAREKDPHSYVMHVEVNRSPIYELHQKGFPPATNWFGFRSSTAVLTASAITANVKISVIKELTSQLRGGSDFDASVFIGTGHQSLRTITNAASRIASALQQTRRGNLVEAAKFLSGKIGPTNRPVKTDAAMSQAWLELRYGWMPLVQDMHDSGIFLSNLLQDPFSWKLRSRKKINKPLPLGTGSTDVIWDSWYCWDRYQVLAIFKEKPSLIYQLGLNNPLNLAWELLPWSFVVDWAIPIGDWLHARGDASSLIGTFVETETSAAGCNGLRLRPGQTAWDNIRGSLANSSSVFNLNRVVSTTLSVPPPSFKPLNKVATWIHAANSIALLNGVKNDIVSSFGNVKKR